MKTSISLIVCALVILIPVHTAYTFDLSKTNKHGSQLKTCACNKDTVVDFYMSAESTINSLDCTSSGVSGLCNTNNLGQSSVNFLDVGGSEEQYTLTSVGLFKTSTKKISRDQEQGVFWFVFMSASTLKELHVAIPFRSGISSTSASKPYQLDLTKISDPAFATIQSASNSLTQSIPLSAFNFLNKRDFGHFYHIADNVDKPTVSYLLGYFILSNINIPVSSLNQLSLEFPLPAYQKDYNYGSSDKLCYGSTRQGIFQTHLRESYPLWTAWLGIFFYWIYILVADASNLNCYDKKFQDNKWTCWGFYSLHNLAHEEYFTRLLRTTQLLIGFSWAGCVLAILYSQIPPGKGPIMILWAALIAVGTAWPFSYVMGYFFLRPIYRLTLHKYEVMQKMKGVFNKKDEAFIACEKDIDDTQQSLYGYYYWYYVLAFVMFSAFWTIAVHEMTLVPREAYYLHYHFLASIGVYLGLENLVFDPFFTLILGNTSFYRIRGFYYDFKMGQVYKEIEE